MKVKFVTFVRLTLMTGALIGLLELSNDPRDLSAFLSQLSSVILRSFAFNQIIKNLNQ